MHATASGITTLDDISTLRIPTRDNSIEIFPVTLKRSASERTVAMLNAVILRGWYIYTVKHEYVCIGYAVMLKIRWPVRRPFA
jgi:hypothetical protein